ncbi:MAG: hypothetical protein NXH75_15895 [Halobacteriovoraceae bacterium]|nr:hypothetical protein [Halobacteriovoraceae bacterium]
MIALILCLFSLIGAEIPKEYEKKPYTKEIVQIVGEDYHYNYGFNDHLGAFRELRWSLNKLNSDNFMFNFGLNDKRGERFQVSPTELQYSMMKTVGGKLVFDYEKIIEESRPLIRPLYLEFLRIVKKYDLSKREKVELIMRFLQDIPYGIPPTNYKNRYIGGLFPPVELLKNKWGDCDSKSLLMATLLSFDKDYFNRLAIILVPGHALLGIRMVPGPYEKCIRFGGFSYVYAEPVGLSRTPLGVTNSPYSLSVEVIPLNLFEPPKDLAIGSSPSPVKEKEGCPDNGLSVEYKHPFNNEMIKSCQKKVAGKYVKHGPTRYFSMEGKLLRVERFGNGEKL